MIGEVDRENLAPLLQEPSASGPAVPSLEENTHTHTEREIIGQSLKLIQSGSEHSPYTIYKKKPKQQHVKKWLITVITTSV